MRLLALATPLLALLLSATASVVPANSAPPPGASASTERSAPASAAAPRFAVSPRPALALVPRVASAPVTESTVPARPTIRWSAIPYGEARRHDMAAYAQRHYGLRTSALRDPKVIVEHMAQAPSFRSVWNTFAPNVPDGELGELPGVCSHFVVERDGRIYQLVSILRMCRHTVGLNWTAIGIEHVGYGEAGVFAGRRQLRASLRLTAWLRCREGIALRDVIGHNESLRSPYHRERVARLRRQTHDDWPRAQMARYRAALARVRCS